MVPSHFPSFLRASVPGGLEPLLGLNAVVIEFEGFLAFDSLIKTPSEQLLYSSHNNSECCDCAGESTRESLITDGYGRPVMQFLRSMDSCCRVWSPETMIVQAPAGTEIGRIEMTPGFFTSTFTMHDQTGQLLASFERNMVNLFGLSYDFTAPIAGGMLLHLGTLERKIACMSTSMIVTFNNISDYRLKVLMIAAAYLVMFIQREKRQH